MTTVTLSALQGWGSEVQSTVSSAATALEEAAPSGAFAGVLEQVAAALRSGPDAVGAATGEETSGAPVTASGPAVPASGLAMAGGSSFSSLVDSLGAGLASGQVTGQDVVAEAESFIGTPYVWGGESPSGFDCSGLVQYVYGQLGVSVPRTSEEQAQTGTPVASLAAASPGDLVFFAGSDGTATSPGHVGIYVGDGMMIDAPHTGTAVQIQPVGAAGNVVAIRRVLPSTATADATLVSSPLSSLSASSSPAATRSVPSSLAPLFVAAAGKYGLPVTLLTAVARHESGFDTTAVSSAGAEGLMQLMPGTAAGLGVTPRTARQAIDGAAQLLSSYLGRFGSVPLALAAYNAGAGAVEQYGGVPPYAQTEAYVQAIMATLGEAA